MASFSWGSILAANVQVMQTQADKAYSDAVALYSQRSKEWIDANLINRDKGLQLTALPVKPRRTIYLVQNGQITEILAAVDSGLQTPVLTTVQTHPADTFSVGTTQDGTLAMILQTVLAIRAKLGA